jgi:heat shock protein HslJ
MNTTKQILAGLAVVIFLGLGAYIIYPQKQIDPNPIVPNQIGSPKDATYGIDGQSVTASVITTQYFGNEVSHDFDGDGRQDTVFILTQNTGGSGTFYYVVVALNTVNGYVGSHGLFLGDRIAPQTTEIAQSPGNSNIVVVNYADRKPNESFAVAPSVAKSIWLLLDPKTMQFGEVAQNFEGEADPTKMTLGMQKWNWIRTLYSDGKIVAPRTTGKFILTLKADKTFSASTDCNGVGGEYTTTGNKITFTKMMSTLMYCDGSQEQDFTKMIGEIQSYHFTSKGELVFDLKMDSGSMIFK